MHTELLDQNFHLVFSQKLAEKQEHTVFVNGLLDSAVKKLKWTKFKKSIRNSVFIKQTSPPRFPMSPLFSYESEA